MSAEKTEALRLVEVSPYLNDSERGAWIIDVKAELRRLAAVEVQRDALRQIVEDFPPIEAELEEVSDRAHRLETQRDALLEVAKLALRMGQYGGVSPRTVEDAARAAIKAVEGEKA